MKAQRKEQRQRQLQRLRLINERDPVEAPRKGVDDGELSYAELIERLVAEELHFPTGPSLPNADDNGSPPNQRQRGEPFLQAHRPPLRERPHGADQQPDHPRPGRDTRTPCDRHDDPGPRGIASTGNPSA